MSLPKFEVDIRIISKLDDEPNDVGGLTADAFKAKFDEAGLELQRYINDTLIPRIEMDIESAALGVGGSGTIGADKIPNKSLDASKLKDGAVTTPILANGSATEAKIADDAVTNAKIADGAVDANKIADKTITAREMADGAINADKIFVGAVTSDKVYPKAITPEKLSDDAKSRGIAVNLSVEDWIDNSQIVEIKGVTETNNVLVAPAPESRTAYSDAEIYCTAQAEGQLTFACVWTPETDVTVNVVVLA